MNFIRRGDHGHANNGTSISNNLHLLCCDIEVEPWIAGICNFGTIYLGFNTRTKLCLVCIQDNLSNSFNEHNDLPLKLCIKKYTNWLLKSSIFDINNMYGYCVFLFFLLYTHIHHFKIFCKLKLYI